MVMIHIKHIVDSADTADQGAVVFAHLSPVLAGNDDVVVSFDGVTTATSSFVNTAFIPLLKMGSLAMIKSRLKIIRSTRQINDMIRSRLEREANFHHAA